MAIKRPSDNLKYMTVRILTSTQENTVWNGAGTGFLFVESKGDKYVPMLITNKHVLDGAFAVGLNFHQTLDGEEPLPGPGRLISLRTSQLSILRHPNPQVDLAGIPLAGIMDHASKVEGWRPFIKCVDQSLLPTDEIVEGMSALEDVVMVGYPIGLADTVNNFPVVRRGITATPYKENYLGKSEFLIDISIFGGSSGSPILMVNEGAYSTANGIAFGNRFLVIGILYAGHTHTLDGQIVAKPVPTNLVPIAQITQMVNLGLCIKSSLFSDLAKQIPDW